MDAQESRAGPGAKEGEPRRIEPPAAAPGHPQRSSESACVYHTAGAGGLQSGAGTVSGSLPSGSGADAPWDLQRVSMEGDFPWDTGWFTVDGVRGRIQVHGGPDGGARQRFLIDLLFGDESGGDGTLDDGVCGVREPLPLPSGSLDGAVAVHVEAGAELASCL